MLLSVSKKMGIQISQTDIADENFPVNDYHEYHDGCKTGFD